MALCRSVPAAILTPPSRCNRKRDGPKVCDAEADVRLLIGGALTV